jgi:tellurite resistance protein TerC
MLIIDFVKIPVLVSLFVVFGILAVTVWLSLVRPPKPGAHA